MKILLAVIVSAMILENPWAAAVAVQVGFIVSLLNVRAG
jgi:hypothetical protein